MSLNYRKSLPFLYLICLAFLSLSKSLTFHPSYCVSMDVYVSLSFTTLCVTSPLYSNLLHSSTPWNLWKIMHYTYHMSLFTGILDRRMDVRCISLKLKLSNLTLKYIKEKQGQKLSIRTKVKVVIRSEGLKVKNHKTSP